MSRKLENKSFIYKNCGKEVIPLTNGIYRNHCPYCLYSLHVDNKPADRNNICNGLIEPVGIYYSSKKGYQIIHKCKLCGVERKNIIAENTVMPDSFPLIILLSKKNK